MKILIAGGTGMIGQALIKELFSQGLNNVGVLTRSFEKAQSTLKCPVELYYWNPHQNEIDQKAMEGVTHIINLVGENIAEKHWNKKQIEKIKESRIKSTALLVDEINKRHNQIQKFISASAIGYYGDKEDRELSENSPKGNTLLSDICEDWEKAAFESTPNTTHLHIIRIGMVLSNTGGALKKLKPIFRNYMGSVLGSGKQYISWIHIDDLVSQIIFLLTSKTEQSVFNATSPNPITNKEFSDALAKSLNSKALFKAPKFALNLVMGDMAQILLDSQRAYPNEFVKAGFEFKFNTIDEAFNDLNQN